MTEAEELDLAKDAIRSLMENTLRQNERMYRALKFYAQSDWREVTMMDRGAKAREVLGEVEG
jgi:hypothetical protein